ncbi:MAG: hypothetical protein LBH42_07260 [Treponema sp.]|jgi:hypothetical protein|nr:hypothetical protein [Treponema sp.]
MIVALLGILFFMVGTTLSAQESSLEQVPGLRERAVVMRIISRIVEQNQEVVWDEENTQLTIPGRPVGIKLVGSDLVVAVQFTPFLRPDGRHLLVAQGQIWINIPNQGISYHTTMQTIPLEFREQVYFFPLGSMRAPDEARIEIQLALEPYHRLNEGAEPRSDSSSPERGRRSEGPPVNPGRNVPRTPR